MVDKKRGLGRGLDALFGDEEVFPGAAPARPVTAELAVPGETGVNRRLAGVDQLQPGRFQPRQRIDDAKLAELAASITEHGVLQPILVRPLDPESGDGAVKFEIIAGERRWRAAQRARLHQVPVIVRPMTDAQALEIALIENLQRADLDALEEALGLQRLADEFGHTQEALAARLGKSRSYVANTLRLLTLPAPVQELLRQGKLTAGHARALVGLDGAERLAQDIVARGLSVRDAERLAKNAAQPAAKNKAGASAGKDVDTLALERDLSARLGLTVALTAKGEKGGVVSITYKSLDQLDGLLRRLSA